MLLGDRFVGCFGGALIIFVSGDHGVGFVEGREVIHCTNVIYVFVTGGGGVSP